MPSKTHHTAVAILPPQEVWEPIQTIRRQYDRQFHRWMPHINLLYPFYPAEHFADVLPRLEDCCARTAPFAVTLTEFRSFVHPSGRGTLWLAPEPRATLVDFQGALTATFPECDDLSRFQDGFTPHLSVGQARSRQEVDRLMAELRATWQPIRFAVATIALIRRTVDRPFRVEQQMALVGRI